MLKDHKAVTPLRLKPAAPRSRVKHATTEPLRSLQKIRPGHYVCCIHSNALKTSFTTEANTVNHDQTAPKGAV